MNKQQESIHDLEKEVQGYVLRMEEIEKSIGTIVLPAQDKRLSSSEIASYASLIQDQKLIMDDIAMIENLQAQITSVKAEQKAVQEKIASLSSEWSELYKVFGKTLLSNYTPQMAGIYGSQFTEIQNLISKIDEMEIQYDTDKKALETQGFFSKMINQVKLSSLGTSISAQKRRLENLYASTGKTVFESNALSKEYENKTLDVLISASMDNLVSLGKEIDTEKKMLDAALIEEKSLVTSLDGIGISGSFNKKFEYFSSKLQTKQEKILEFYKKTGDAYITSYISPEGSMLSDIPSDIDSSVSQMILEAQKLKTALYTASQKIEILKITAQIEDKEKSIASMQQSIADNEVRISRMQAQNAELAGKITAQADGKDELLRKKAELEKTIK